MAKDTIKRIDINPKYKNLIPPLAAEEYMELEKSIMQDGCRDAIITWNGFIMDGHNRYEICERHGVKFTTVEKIFADDNEAKSWIIRNQFARRNLNTYQRSVLALKLEEILKPAARDKQLGMLKKGNEIPVPPTLAKREIDTREEIAKTANVAHGTIDKVKVIERKASPEVKQALAAGETSINAEYKKLTIHVGQNTGENEWYTPEYLIEAARNTMGEIDCDPASSEQANKIVKAKKIYTKETNGLDKKWGKRVWTNPPYAQPLISQFSDAIVEKIKSGEVGEACVLVNNATETEWLQNILTICNAVCLVKRRIKFLDVNGKPGGAPLQGQIVVYMGNNLRLFTENFSEYGVIFYREI